MLLAHGANVNTLDFDGWTALPFAVKRNSRAIASILTQAGTDIDAMTTQGWAPLRFRLEWMNEQRKKHS